MRSTYTLILFVILYAFMVSASTNNMVIKKGTAKHAATLLKRNYSKRQQQQPSVDVNTALQQNTAQVYRYLSSGGLFLNFPDNGPQE